MFSPQGSGQESIHGHGQDTLMSISPVSTGPSAAQHISSPFLPGYLLGDHHNMHQQQHGLSSPRLWSTPSSHSPSQKAPLSNQSMQQAHSGSSLVRRESGRGRMGGPPVKSLYSSPPTLERTTSQVGFPHNQSLNIPSSNLRSANMSMSGSPAVGTLSQTPVGYRDANSSIMMSQVSGQNIPASPAQVDPFYTQGDLKSDDVLDETWVTVFGFLPGASSFILQQFAQYGTILKHVVASECNWMHIQYQSKIQAKKALSKDGKVFAGCMKIGVTVCIEKNVMEEKENTLSILSPKSGKDFHRESALTPIRPLTAAYSASKSDYEVLQDRQTPKRDHGLVSKLKEYMFGY